MGDQTLPTAVSTSHQVEHVILWSITSFQFAGHVGALVRNYQFFQMGFGVLQFAVRAWLVTWASFGNGIAWGGWLFKEFLEVASVSWNLMSLSSAVSFWGVMHWQVWWFCPYLFGSVITEGVHIFGVVSNTVATDSSVSLFVVDFATTFIRKGQNLVKVWSALGLASHLQMVASNVPDCLTTALMRARKWWG